MKTTIGMPHSTGPHGPLGDHFGSGDQGVVHCTVSSRAGRLLFALLLSTTDPVRSDTTVHLSKLANIPTKQLPAYIDELSVVELVTVQEQSPGLENAVDAAGTQPASISIAHKGTEKLPILNSSQNYLPVEPSDAVEAECDTADQIEDPLARARAQALAVVRAWEVLFPEVNKVQELQPRKAKEWVKSAGSSATVFGWLGGVDEGKLLSMQFPLAYVNKMVTNKSEEAKKRQPQVEEAGDAMDGWREYAQKIIDQGGNNHHGPQDSGGTLLRIAGRVKSRTEEPS